VSLIVEEEGRWSVHYELYIDVFFLVNVTMDYLLLAVIRKLLGCRISHGRICLGALSGALLTCLIVALPIPYTSVKFILFHGLANIVMIKAGLGIKGMRELGKALILLYVSGFLTGGVFQFFGQYVRVGSVFFVLAVISYYVVSGILRLIVYLTGKNEYRCQVILLKGERSHRVEALIDTGNSLRDTVTGKPVSIIDKKAAKKLWGENDMTGIRYISYHSIGKAEGVMPLITLDGMYVCRKEKEWIERPLAAICEEDMTADRYEMILNPDVLIGGVKYGNQSSSTTSI